MEVRLRLNIFTGLSPSQFVQVAAACVQVNDG
jgi:hypothetical protein